MSGIQFTPAQAAAIAARGGSLLVSAAAGSGKTRVLVERVAGLITDPDHPVEADSLLIMTFTNAAAAKLRADITERLAAAVRADPANQRLRRQQLRLQRASIGTVDAFCLHFVQQHFSALEVPPDFETADEASLERIRQEVLADTLETAYTDPDFRAFADLYDRNRTDNTAGSVVLEVYNFTRALPNPEKALREFAGAWQADADPAATRWGQALLQAALNRAQGAVSLLRAAARIAVKDDAADRAYTAVLQDDEDRATLLCRALQGSEWDKAVEALALVGSDTWRTAGRIKGGKAGNPAASAASALRDRAKKQLTALQEDFLVCNTEEFRQDRRRAAPLVAALVRTVQQFADAYFAAKREEKLLDYADYEHLTLRLLQTEDGRRTPLCDTVSRRYSAVLVDEYQDTNALQDAIYFALASPKGDNLFFVGDIKQSIYRFRQAEPGVFIAKQQAWGAYPQPQGAPSALALDANFRSAPAVIGGINYFFETFFSPQLGGVAYGDGQRLVVGLPGAYQGLCELDFLPGADTAAEARAIAARIGQMVEEGFLVREKGAARPAGYGDFCILLRSRGSFAAYASALEAVGIPAYADVAADLLDAPHIRPFAALLRIIDNPAQDVPLAAVLLSPLFGYTVDDLVHLRAAQPAGSLYGAVLHGGQTRFAPFLQALADYRRLARTLPVEQLLEELFARTGYLAAVGAMPEGARCREELLGFAAWAGGAGRAGLPALIRAMDAAQQGGGLTQSGGGQSRPGCVSIMTVHRSKGLEFPVVFVADTTHQFNTADTSRPVLAHRTLGLGLQLRAGSTAKRYKTLPYAALAQTIKMETLSEEMRVLYVALTRAQDALILSVPAKKPETEMKSPALCAAAEATGPAAMQGMKSWAGWLLTAALLHPASTELWNYAELLPHHRDTAAPLTLRVVTPPEEAPAPPPAPPALPDETLKQSLLEGFRWQYPDAELTAIPAKVSVSAVTHAQKETVLQRPAFMQKQGLTGAEKGTAIHAFLQSVPFDGQTPDLPAEVERQIQLQLLDPALAEKLELDRVRPFFEGPVWRRICAAKEVLREAPFITSLPARTVDPATQSEAPVLVQGIADLVLVFDDHAEILDYKTDRSTDPSYYKEEYAAQLRLYRRAFGPRLPVPVTKLTIYSFALAAEIDVT